MRPHGEAHAIDWPRFRYTLDELLLRAHTHARAAARGGRAPGARVKNRSKNQVFVPTKHTTQLLDTLLQSDAQQLAKTSVCIYTSVDICFFLQVYIIESEPHGSASISHRPIAESHASVSTLKPQTHRLITTEHRSSRESVAVAVLVCEGRHDVTTAADSGHAPIGSNRITSLRVLHALLLASSVGTEPRVAVALGLGITSRDAFKMPDVGACLAHTHAPPPLATTTAGALVPGAICCVCWIQFDGAHTAKQSRRRSRQEKAQLVWVDGATLLVHPLVALLRSQVTVVSEEVARRFLSAELFELPCRPS